MTIRTTLLISLAMLSMATLAAEPIQLQDNQAVVQVKGVVCSFCAFGTQKNLGKLDFLDKSQHSGDGVLMDIKNHHITLALDPIKPVDLSAIHKAIVDGGYDPVDADMRIHGRVERRDGAVILNNPVNGQFWRLEGEGIDGLSVGLAIIVEGRVAAVDFADTSVSTVTPITVTRIEEDK